METTHVMSNYLMEKIINHIFRNTPYSPPAQLHMGLFKYNSSMQLVELSGNGYSRAYCPRWNIVGYSAGNIEAFLFPQATADWGTIVYSALFDSHSGGNILFGGYTNQVYIYAGNKVSIGEDDLHLEFKSVNTYGGWCTETVSSIMDFILNLGSFTSPGTSLYLALGTEAILHYPSYNLEFFSECPSSEGYNRIQVGGSTKWTAPSNGTTSNVDDILFTESATGYWLSLACMALFNSSSAGNKIMWIGLEPGDGFDISPGDGVKIKAGALSVRLGALYIDPIESPEPIYVT